MFDFNCDLAQSYGIYKNDTEFEIAQYASSVNISAGFHAGDPMTIRRALLFVENRNIALGAHIGYPDIAGFGKRKMDLDKEELIALITYQVGAIAAYSKTFGLEIEQVRSHGALKETLCESEEMLETYAIAIKKINPWLNIIVQDEKSKEFLNSYGARAALEVDFSKFGSIREIRETGLKIDTIHFNSLEDIKKAYDIIKPTPINYNNVQGQV